MRAFVFQIANALVPIRGTALSRTRSGEIEILNIELGCRTLLRWTENDISDITPKPRRRQTKSWLYDFLPPIANFERGQELMIVSVDPADKIRTFRSTTNRLQALHIQIDKLVRADKEWTLRLGAP